MVIATCCAAEEIPRAAEGEADAFLVITHIGHFGIPSFTLQLLQHFFPLFSFLYFIFFKNSFLLFLLFITR